MGTQQDGTGTTMKRRGLIAGAAALVAGIVAKQTSQPVRAATDTNFVAHNGTGTAFHNDTATYDTGIAVSGVSIGISAVGITLTSTGVTAVGGTGVAGFGSAGNATEVGVHGQCQLGTGVQGVIPNTSGAANTVAVQATNQSTGTGGKGVYALVNGGTATGTMGIYGANVTNAADAHGIIGLSQSGHGLVGISNASGPFFAGLVGNAGPNGAAAGNFYGNVNITQGLFINGQMVVAGPKSAALAHPDGSHRLVYCVEAPESWLEDFGEGTLSGGKADVKIDPDFAAVADMAKYHVFITTYTDSNGHFIANQGPTGFTVQERNKGAASGRFSWRVVAKRKDVKAGRLAKFSVPQLTPPLIPSPNVPDLPTPPAPKKP